MKISVITVCLNRVGMLERAIQSVLNQAYDELEYIIIDGGSTDGTIDIIKKYEQKITYWISEPDEGIYDAMNKGIAKATGEVVAFLNSDDWYEDNTLKRVADYFEQYNPMILSGNINVLKMGEWKKLTLKLDEEEENIRIGMNCRHPATFVRRQLFKRFGKFDTQYKIAADYEWMLRVYDGGIRTLKVKDIFTNFSSSGISSTASEETIKEARCIALSALDRNCHYDEQEKEVWRKKIHELYDGQEDILKVRKMIRNNQMADFISLKNKVMEYLSEKSCAIWGTGIIGNEIYRLLSQLGIEVEFFIDSRVSNNETKYKDKPVKSPQMIKRGEKIIVASMEYEDEIITCLKEMDFHKNVDYISYSKLMELLVAVYRAEVKES